MKKYLTNFYALFVLVLLVTVYLIALLYGPRLSDEEIQKQNLWLIDVTLIGKYGFNLNKDSFYYMEAAKKPAKLFDNKSVLQSRPLLPLIASLPTKIIDNYIFAGRYRDVSNTSVGYWYSPYIVYAVFNITILLLSFFLFLLLLSRYCSTSDNLYSIINPSRLPFIFGFLLIFNDITKAFIFSAHIQMLNIFLPLLTLYFSLFVYFSASLKSSQIIFLSFMIGVGALLYGSFVVCEAAIILAFTIREIKIQNNKLLETMMINLANLFVFAMPLLGWYLIVKIVSGHYYNHEIERWNQLVWILDVREKGAYWLLSVLFNNVLFFTKAMLHYPITLLAASPILVVFIYQIMRHCNTVGNDYKVINWCLIILFIFIIFFSFVGYLVERLAFPSTTMLIVIVGLISCHVEKNIMNSNRRKALIIICWGFVVSSGVLTVLKDGPYY